MPFHFTLQPLFRLRQSLEDRERLRLARLLAFLGKVNQQCRHLDADRNQILNELGNRLQSGMLAGELHFERARAEAVQRNKRVLLVQKAQLEKEKNVQEVALTDAQRRRKIVENLRARQLELYGQTQRRVEQQRTDDLHSAGVTNRS